MHTFKINNWSVKVDTLILQLQNNPLLSLSFSLSFIPPPPLTHVEEHKNAINTKLVQRLMSWLRDCSRVERTTWLVSTPKFSYTYDWMILTAGQCPSANLHSSIATNVHHFQSMQDWFRDTASLASQTLSSTIDLWPIFHVAWSIGNCWKCKEKVLAG